MNDGRCEVRSLCAQVKAEPKNAEPEQPEPRPVPADSVKRRFLCYSFLLRHWNVLLFSLMSYMSTFSVAPELQAEAQSLTGHNVPPLKSLLSLSFLRFPRSSHHHHLFMLRAFLRAAPVDSRCKPEATSEVVLCDGGVRNTVVQRRPQGQGSVLVCLGLESFQLSKLY